MEPATVLILVGLLLLFLNGTYDRVKDVLDTRRERRLNAGPQARCSCGCAYGFHYEGSCHGSLKREIKWKRDEDDEVFPVAWEYVPCPCRAYVGPQPVELMGHLMLPQWPDPPAIDMAKKENQ